LRRHFSTFPLVGFTRRNGKTGDGSAVTKAPKARRGTPLAALTASRLPQAGLRPAILAPLMWNPDGKMTGGARSQRRGIVSVGEICKAKQISGRLIATKGRMMSIVAFEDYAGPLKRAIKKGRENLRRFVEKWGTE